MDVEMNKEMRGVGGSRGAEVVVGMLVHIMKNSAQVTGVQNGSPHL